MLITHKTSTITRIGYTVSIPSFIVLVSNINGTQCNKPINFGEFGIEWGLTLQSIFAEHIIRCKFACALDRGPIQHQILQIDPLWIDKLADQNFFIFRFRCTNISHCFIDNINRAKLIIHIKLVIKYKYKIFFINKVSHECSGDKIFLF